MIDAEITEGKVVLINYESKGHGPLNAELPEMFQDAGFSLLAEGFEREPMGEDGGVRVEVIEEDIEELVEWLEDNFLSDQPAFDKIRNR